MHHDKQIHQGAAEEELVQSILDVCAQLRDRGANQVPQHHHLFRFLSVSFLLFSLPSHIGALLLPLFPSPRFVFTAPGAYTEAQKQM